MCGVPEKYVCQVRRVEKCTRGPEDLSPNVGILPRHDERGSRRGRRDKLVKDQGRGEKLIREVHRRRKKVESYSRKRVKKQGSTFRRDVGGF